MPGLALEACPFGQPGPALYEALWVASAIPALGRQVWALPSEGADNTLGGGGVSWADLQRTRLTWARCSDQGGFCRVGEATDMEVERVGSM